jgi:hypothetical protein
MIGDKITHAVIIVVKFSAEDYVTYWVVEKSQIRWGVGECSQSEFKWLFILQMSTDDIAVKTPRCWLNLIEYSKKKKVLMIFVFDSERCWTKSETWCQLKTPPGSRRWCTGSTRPHGRRRPRPRRRLTNRSPLPRGYVLPRLIFGLFVIVRKIKRRHAAIRLFLIRCAKNN